MKITFDATEKAERELYTNELAGHELLFLESPVHEMQDMMRGTEILSVFVSSSVTREMIAQMPDLKCITTRSMGFDHIDMAAAKERGIPVSYVPSYGTRTVAEFGFALILTLSRKAYQSYDKLRTDGSVDVQAFEGFDLSGKTLGVIGTGKIGKNMARIGRGFDMNVHLCDAFPDEAFAQEITSAYCSIEKLVKESDIVSIHVPLMPQTQHLVNAALLAQFKPGSILINTSRGGVVDTKALVESLKSGHLSGAGLDVIEGERALFNEAALLSGEHNKTEFEELVAAHALIDMPNVIVTPHIAFNTKEAKHEIASITVKNIASFLSGTSENTVKI